MLSVTWTGTVRADLSFRGGCGRVPVENLCLAGLAARVWWKANAAGENCAVRSGNAGAALSRWTRRFRVETNWFAWSNAAQFESIL
jgi:hypothetical protein